MNPALKTSLIETLRNFIIKAEELKKTKYKFNLIKQAKLTNALKTADAQIDHLEKLKPTS